MKMWKEIGCTSESPEIKGKLNKDKIAIAATPCVEMCCFCGPADLELLINLCEVN